MREVLDASERRKLEVVEHLYFTRGWVTLKELAQKTVSSERILKQDMLQLRDYFSKEVLQTSHLGVRLALPPHKDCDDLYRYFLSNSLALKFVEMLIYDETKTVFELAEELYVSPSTLFRLIKKLNLSLADYYVQVQTNPCKLISENEESIRYFKNEIITTLYTNPTFSLKQLNNHAYDILITTFTLPFDDKTIEQSCICIRNVPTKRNITDIAQAIEQQYKVKKHSFKSILQEFIQF